jgi:hypothetical protein
VVTYVFLNKTAPSPKAFMASLIALFIWVQTPLHSRLRIPFPPPPAEALIKIGSLFLLQLLLLFQYRWLRLSREPWNIIGFNRFFGSQLTPIMCMAFDLGPIK